MATGNGSQAGALKVKRDEQALKGRNVTRLPADAAYRELAKGISLTLHEIISGVSISDSELSEKENLCLLMEELSGIDGTEALPFHENHRVGHLALSITENPVSGEEENDRILPGLG